MPFCCVLTCIQKLDYYNKNLLCTIYSHILRYIYVCVCLCINIYVYAYFSLNVHRYKYLYLQICVFMNTELNHLVTFIFYNSWSFSMAICQILYGVVIYTLYKHLIIEISSFDLSENLCKLTSVYWVWGLSLYHR